MPADVGLPTSLCRRAAGLRREEVAVLAGLSPSWYTYLEQGRDINPSAEESPYPVYGADRYGEVIAWNYAATSYYTDWARLLEGRRNMIRWLVEAREAKERLLDWSDDVRDIVARWRATTAMYDRGGGRLQALVEEFKQSSPELGRWWDSHDVREQRSRLRGFRHPEHGEQTILSDTRLQVSVSTTRPSRGGRPGR